MLGNRVEFYDPLYDFVTFEEAALQRTRSFFDIGFSKGSATHGDSITPLKESKVIVPFLSTLEFTRQSFLRQSNLAFLVYPSATHTRLAHAIGSCYLGFLASQRVSVKRGFGFNRASTPPIYLSEFLEKTGWREEFYLALLLHDVGHYPFSHALENNIDFWQALGERLSHEAATCQLIEGSGSFYEALTRRNADISSDIRNDYPHVSDLLLSRESIDKSAICYLVSGDEGFLKEKEDRQISQLQVIHELVSGLLDLDRIDHYRRDNYFTGLRTGTSPNFSSLLSGLTICYEPLKPRRQPEVQLSPAAVGQAISLLASKERLTEDCFEHATNIAYEAMLHHAFNLFMFGDRFYENEVPEINSGLRALAYDLLAGTDEELLIRLRSDGSQEVRNIVFRILHRAPYTAVVRLVLPPEHGKSLSEIRSTVMRCSALPGIEVVLRAFGRFGTRSLGLRTGEWLDLERLRNAEGKRLVEGKYKRQIEHFKEAQEDLSEPVWIFARTEETAARMRECINKLCEELDCRREET